MSRRHSRSIGSKSGQKTVVFGLVIVLIAGFVGALALSGGDTSVTSGTPASEETVTTRTLTPGPPEDETTYFTGMNANWESTWEQSGATEQASTCERWLVDPFTLLTADSIPPDLPSNITEDTFRKRLSDFLIGKCGMPTQESNAPPEPAVGQ